MTMGLGEDDSNVLKHLMAKDAQSCEYTKNL